MHSRPLMSPGILPGDNKKSRAIPSCGARRPAPPAFPAVDVARHLAKRRQEVPRDPFLRGRRLKGEAAPSHAARHLSPGISPATRPAWPLRGARRPIPSAVAVAVWYKNLEVQCGGHGLFQEHRVRTTAPNILPATKRSCAGSEWGAAATTFGRCHQGEAAPHFAARQPSLGISPATRPAWPLRGARRPIPSAVAVAVR